MLPSNILFIFTGSIACYKAVAAVSKLVQQGHKVHCVMTSSAQNFIGKATLEGLTGNTVHSDLFNEGQTMSHIQLVRQADLIVVAPATANYINKLASGIADDLASTLFLAHDFEKPFIVFPAMNSKMYLHPITQDSIRKLANIGIIVMETGSGVLACGEEGEGKLLDPDVIVAEISKQLSSQDNSNIDTAKNQNKPPILITGGGTVEEIDSVRSISNKSSGATAIELAKHFNRAGNKVTLLLSSSNQSVIDSEIDVYRFTSFQDLQGLLKEHLQNTHFDYIFHAAAVSDFSIKEIKIAGKDIELAGKIPSGQEILLYLKPNIKLISQLKNYSCNKEIKIIAFKLTDEKEVQKQQAAVEKLFQNPNVELVIHNDLSQIDPDKSKHKYQIYNHSNYNTVQLDGVNSLALYLSQYISKEVYQKNLSEVEL
ncbi:MAG: bifunctional phosphopantothenoylcysteine decarboxylase/phosphopantothenate--cysteine ligase CoaBC [Bdellovibrionales bacterium]|nr:bifunctional phosphopantothenoylcysteine decarboxylase/phosphopantothenate--cysteine ligase CoaBC [Bdellovibrionales bacterium]